MASSHSISLIMGFSGITMENTEKPCKKLKLCCLLGRSLFIYLFYWLQAMEFCLMFSEGGNANRQHISFQSQSLDYGKLKKMVKREKREGNKGSRKIQSSDFLSQVICSKHYMVLYRAFVSITLLIEFISHNHKWIYAAHFDEILVSFQ